MIFASLLGVKIAIADDMSVFYTYNREGGIHTTFVNRVDSITFSRIDAEGYEHDDIVSQLIWMPDTVVRIDIAAVDSVSFRAPATIYNPEAIVLDQSPMWGYVRWADYTNISLNPSISRADLPKAGDRLVTVQTNEHFPAGFAGEVEKVTVTSDSVLVSCKVINPALVLDRHYCVGKTTEIPIEITKSPRRKPVDGMEYGEAPFILGFQRDFDFTAGQYMSKYDEDYRRAGFETAAEGSYSWYMTGRVIAAARYFDKNVFVDAYIETDQEYKFNFNLTGGFAARTDFSNIPAVEDLSFRSVIPQVPFLEVYGKINPLVDFKADLGMEVDYEKRVGDSYHIAYNSNPNIRSFFTTSHNDYFENLDFKFMGEAQIKVGAEAEFAIRNAGYIDEDFGEFGLKAYVEGEIGAKLSASMLFPAGSYLDHETSTSYYEEAMDESNVSLGVYGQVAAGAKGVAMFKDPVHHQQYGGSVGVKAESPEWNFPIAKRDFFPVFETPRFFGITKGNPVSLFTSNLSNKLLLPVKVGYKVMDENNDEICKGFYDNSYRVPEDFMNYELPVEDVSMMLNRKCKAYPLFKFVNWEILATPAVDVELTVTPVTGGTDGVQSTSATLTGWVEGAQYLATPNFAGIKISTAPQLSAGSRGGNAALDEDGNMRVTFDGLKKNTKYYYAAFVAVNGEFEWGETKSFTTPDDDFVDLGLSVNWASYNVGGKVETDTGMYFAWGETADKDSYSWSNYFDSPYDADGSWVGCSQVTSDITGGSRDAAAYIMGGTWRMPSQDEMKELVDNCDWEWTTINNVNGFKVKSRINGNYIFLPATGNFDGTSVSNKGTYGAYWTGTVRPSSDSSTAGNLYFVKSVKSTQWGNRYLGRVIRAVCPK